MSSAVLPRKPPRKLDRMKCENCRQAKKKCIATGLGCKRCLVKGMECPGRTKAGEFSEKASLATQEGGIRSMLSRSVTAQTEWKESLGLDFLSCVEQEAIPTEHPQSHKQTTTFDSISEKIACAMEEIDGLENGMDLVDCVSVDDDNDEDLFPENAALHNLPVHEGGTSCGVATADELEGLLKFLRSCQKIYTESVLVDGWEKPTDAWGLLPKQHGSTYAWLSPESFYESLATFTEFAESLSQIQLWCDGRFVCTHQSCIHRSFDASWEALEDHYYSYHPVTELDRRLRLASDKESSKLRHKQFNRRVQRAAMSRNEWTSWKNTRHRHNWEIALRIISGSSSRRNLDCHKVISQTRQLQDFRALRKSFRIRYKDFLRRSKSSPELSEFAAILRSTYKVPRGLHRLGFEVFRSVLTGKAPTTVLEVFAFELLSGAMADVMLNVWNKEIPHQPQAIDYLVWRNTIQDADGRDLFDHLLDNWFPYFMLPQVDTASLMTSSHEVMRDFILNLVCRSEAGGPPNFSAFSSPEITRSIYGTGVLTREIDRGSFDSLWGVESVAWQGGALQVGPTLIAIRNSIVFMLVYLFMIYVTERGILVIYLGNRERRCKNLGFEATAGRILQVSESLKSKVIDPLMTMFSDAPLFLWLLETTKAVVDCGQTWSVEELHHILQCAVKGAVEEPVLQPQWLAEVDRLCQLAHESIAPAYGQ